jgi:hypothetical protein
MSRHEQRRRLSALHDGTILRDGESVPVSDNGFGYLKCRAGHETFKVHKIVAEELLGRSGLVDFPRIAELLTDAGQWGSATFQIDVPLANKPPRQCQAVRPVISDARNCRAT